MKNKKKNGVFYTPPQLADHLVKPFIGCGGKSILDPAYGDGALLLSAERILVNPHKKLSIDLFGCDIKPVNGLLQHLPEANLQKLDFFEYPIDKKHNLILTNPPFVRQHYQNNNKIATYRKNVEELQILGNKADLWAFFLVKCTAHLTKGGSVGAILPWAFLQANYAQPLRKWLTENFEEIKVLALTEKYFVDADERVILVWLNNFQTTCSNILIGSSKQVANDISYQKITEEKWLQRKVQTYSNINYDSILAKIEALGFQEVSKYATIKIGVVTGAVKYFILPIKEAKAKGFEARDTLPIISSIKEMKNYLKNGTRLLRRLLLFKSKNNKIKKYILLGKQKKVDKRRHSELRKPWYSVNIGKIPDAFFPYRISKWPFLMQNKSRIQSTNSIHRVYFKDLTPTQKKWLTLSLSTSFAQFTIEKNAKTYGRGMLKIEPGDFNKTLVLVRNDRSIDRVYNNFQSLIAQDKLQEAVEYATKFICEKLAITRDFADEVLLAVSLLQKNRGA